MSGSESLPTLAIFFKTVPTTTHFGQALALDYKSEIT